VADANRDVIVGIKVRVGRHASGDQGVAPLDIALQVAEETGMPLMAISTSRPRPTRRSSTSCGPATC
jgi:predicted amidohydrolase